MLKSETVSTIKPRIAGFYQSSQAKGTNSTSFLTCVRNEVELVPLACEDGFYLKIYNVPSPVTFSESTKANEPLPRCGRDMFRCTLQRVLHSSKHALAASGRLYPVSLAEEGVGDTTHTVTYMYEITLYMLGIFFSCFCCRLQTFFFKSNFYQTFFQEDYQGVMCGFRGGGGVQGVRTPLKNHKKI